jgi:Protein of unknown function (DUF2568)
MLELIKGANLALRFVLELCTLGALGYWGFKTGSGALARIGLGIGAPLVAAVVWGTFVAPRAPVQLPGPVSLLLQMLILRSGCREPSRHRASYPRLGVRGTGRDQRHPHVRLGAMTLCPTSALFLVFGS